MQFKTLTLFVFTMLVLSLPTLAKGGVDGVLILRTGDRISAKIEDISSQMIHFEAKSSRQAYKYGQEISVGEVERIETSEGEVLTVEHFRETFFAPSQVVPKSKPKPASDNRVPKRRRVPEPRERERNGSYDTIAASLIDAGLAAAYLDYVREYETRLTAAEKRLRRAIEDNPQWAEKIDDLRYIDGIAREALSRAFRYQPEELRNKLGLQLQERRDMNYEDLMKQLYDQFGTRISKSEFETFQDVFGTGPARAISDIIENYSSWKFLRKTSK